MRKIIKQIKQFFKPFPEPGSLSYNLQMLWYDLAINVLRPFFGDLGGDDEENDNDDINAETNILDVPAYIRRNGDVDLGETNGGQHENGNGKPTASDDGSESGINNDL